MLTEYLREKIYGMFAGIVIVIWLSVAVRVSAAGNPLPRKVVLNADNLEILRLDMMGMEVRICNNVKEQADQVEAALDRHGAKLDESGADLRGPTSQWLRLWIGRPPAWTSWKGSFTN